MADLTDLSITEAVQALRSGEISSRELTSACLERIDRLEPHLHAFITLTPDLALRQAAQADARLASARRAPDGPLPPLLGLPIAVKDVLCVEGVRATAGSAALDGFVPRYTATPVSRLIDAGVVILGKTNTDEFAMGSSTENSAFGATRNPWDLERVPGGSSGGSAAAVAARLAPGALGTDTGGSVRQPASFCGVTGIKPTYGRTSRYGLIAYGSSLDSVGALARSAADLALLFAPMAGHDPRDATSLDAPMPSFTLDAGANLAGLRVGVPAEYFIA
ncbi:MAG TPA: amidase, partial [Anaerolineaceae bacterium]